MLITTIDDLFKIETLFAKVLSSQAHKAISRVLLMSITVVLLLYIVRCVCVEIIGQSDSQCLLALVRPRERRWFKEEYYHRGGYYYKE